MDWTSPVLTIILGVNLALPRKTTASDLLGLARSFQEFRNFLRVIMELLEFVSFMLQEV